MRKMSFFKITFDVNLQLFLRIHYYYLLLYSILTKTIKNTKYCNDWLSFTHKPTLLGSTHLYYTVIL